MNRTRRDVRYNQDHGGIVARRLQQNVPDSVCVWMIGRTTNNGSKSLSFEASPRAKLISITDSVKGSYRLFSATLGV